MNTSANPVKPVSVRKVRTVKLPKETSPLQPVDLHGAPTGPLTGLEGIAGMNIPGKGLPTEVLQLVGTGKLPTPEVGLQLQRGIKEKPVVTRANKKVCEHIVVKSSDLEFGTVQSNINGHKTLKTLEPHGGDMVVSGVTLGTEPTSVTDIEVTDLEEAETAQRGFQQPTDDTILAKGTDTLTFKKGTTGRKRGGWRQSGRGIPNVVSNLK